MLKKVTFAVIGMAFFAAPLLASASTLSDLQAQLQSLISQIQVLQSSQGSASGSLAGSVSASCPSFARSLSIGSTGSDVSALQQFLATQGDLNVSATGYFGALTKAAVGKWQAQNGITASGSAGFGIFGPLSRSYLSRTCTTGAAGGGTTITTNPTQPGFSATPASGAAPLTVQFVSSAPQGSDVGTSVSFGDGTSGNLAFVPTCSSCNAMGTVSHTYLSAGTYTATLTGGSCSCPANGICNCPNMQILGTATVEVEAAPTGTTSSAIQQLNAPGSVSLSPGGIAEIRNESFYFTLESLTSSSATIQTTPVGCWNSFPSDAPPQIRCMIAMLPIPPQTLTIGQEYLSGNYGITLTQIENGTATFSVSATSAVQ